MRRLLSFAYRHLETYQIAKCFLYPEWENVDIDNIKKSNVKNEYFVTSIQDNNIIYIINYKIRICSYPIEINGAPCKHQRVILAKFHIITLNFLLSLTSED